MGELLTKHELYYFFTQANHYKLKVNLLINVNDIQIQITHAQTNYTCTRPNGVHQEKTFCTILQIIVF